MPEKNKLTRIFRKAAAPALTALCFFAGSAAGVEPPSPPPTNDNSVYLCDSKNHVPEKAQPLTEDEVALVRSVFGDAVNTAPERKYFLPVDPKYVAMTCQDGGKSLEFFGTGARPSDYSHETVYNYGVFLHEMTHVWQFQMGGYAHCTTYEYPIDSQHKFSDYCNEQQAAIVEDYARHFLHPDHGDGYRYPYKNQSESYTLLAKVVEDRFPEAQKTRLALEAKEKAAKPPAPSPPPPPAVTPQPQPNS